MNLMRIADYESKKSLNEVTLFLNNQEIDQLINSLNQLKKMPVTEHIHVTSEDYRCEITISHFDQSNSSSYDAFSQKIILED